MQANRTAEISDQESKQALEPVRLSAQSKVENKIGVISDDVETSTQ